MVFLHGIYLGALLLEWSKVYPHFTMEWEVFAPRLDWLWRIGTPVREHGRH